MIFKFFISIVFIAELIIAASSANYLLRLNKHIIGLNDIITEMQPKIKEVLVLIKNISEQLLELIPECIESLKTKAEDFLFSKIKGLLTGILLWKLNIKLINKIKKSFIFKTAWKGFTLIRNMI